MALNYAYYQPNGEKAPVEGRQDNEKDEAALRRRAAFEQIKQSQGNGIQGIDLQAIGTPGVPSFQPPQVPQGGEATINEFGEIIRNGGEEKDGPKLGR